jgi:hypothetical protein
MIKDRIQRFFLGLGEKLMSIAEIRIKEQIPQIQAQVEETVKERIPALRAQVEETVKEKGFEFASQVRTQAETAVKSQFSGEKIIPRVETFTGGMMAGDAMVTTPFAVGFLVSGGVGGLLAFPFKLVRVVLLRPIFGSRKVVPRVRIDRNSKDLGRALAALASADRRLRRRRGLIGIFLPSFRKLVVLGGAGAAYVVVTNNGNPDELLEAIVPKIEKVKETVENTELYSLIAPDIEKAVAQLGERVDAIR